MMRLLRVLFLLAIPAVLTAQTTAPAEVKDLKITILSTMLADDDALGEWGFSALVEVDGHRILYDTGTHGDIVLHNARALDVDLTTIPDVILSHHHSDHTGGLMTLRQSVLPAHPEALARVHVGRGIFNSRQAKRPRVEINQMIALKPEYEKTGITFIVHDHPDQLFPGVWLTGPVPRKYPEHNWSGNAQLVTPTGLVEDNLPEDSALVFNTDHGLVVLTGCGHAGIVNICTYAQQIVRPARFRAIIGGIHLFDASEETVTWTGRQLDGFGVDAFIGAHCTGVETVYAFRTLLHLDKAHAVVGAVGQTYSLKDGIAVGDIVR